MAKHVILESYAFTPSTRTITINGKTLRREQLVLITNVTTNTVIYNFADSSLTASSYTISTTNNVETTTIVLTYNTTGMSASDKLAILVEETNETFQPNEAFTDPVGKLRTSTPQALIDTDFEYGPQATKWESIGLLNNKPTAYINVTQNFANTIGPFGPMVFTDIIANTNTNVIYVATLTPPAINSMVIVTDTNWPPAEGTFMVDNFSKSFGAMQAIVKTENIPSQKVFEKLGWEKKILYVKK